MSLEINFYSTSTVNAKRMEIKLRSPWIPTMLYASDTLTHLDNPMDMLSGTKELFRTSIQKRHSRKVHTPRVEGHCKVDNAQTLLPSSEGDHHWHALALTWSSQMPLGSLSRSIDPQPQRHNSQRPSLEACAWLPPHTHRHLLSLSTWWWWPGCLLWGLQTPSGRELESGKNDYFLWSELTIMLQLPNLRTLRRALLRSTHLLLHLLWIISPCNLQKWKQGSEELHWVKVSGTAWR